MPVRSIGPHQRDRLAAHLLALDGRSRYLRFGYAATDEQIVRYVASIDFSRDDVFGIYNRRLELVAFAHLAYAAGERRPEGEPMAEFGVSVLDRYRGRGFGHRLFAHAMLRARNRGVRLLFIHALTENTAMLKIARAAGARVEREGSESQAWLRLPPSSIASQVDEALAEQAAAIDYRWKAYARRLGSLLAAAPPADA